MHFGNDGNVRAAALSFERCAHAGQSGTEHQHVVVENHNIPALVCGLPQPVGATGAIDIPREDWPALGLKATLAQCIRLTGRRAMRAAG